MSYNEAVQLVPYLAALGISSLVLISTWQRRRSPGALAFSIYLLGQSLWIAGFILELVSTSLSGKIFWDGQQWLVGLLYIIALPVFAIQFTEQKLTRPKPFFLGLLIVPVLFIVLLVTDSYTHWVYKNPDIISGSLFSELIYDFTPVTYGIALYGYGQLFWGLYILLRRTLRPHGLYRTQLILITIGILIPVLGTMLTMLNIRITPQRDSIPLTATLGNLILALGIFRYGIFKVMSIGREQVFDAIVDPVVILDKKGVIVDINSSMIGLLGKPAKDVIGEDARRVFRDFPIPIHKHIQSSYAREDATFDIGGMKIHYELTVMPLFSARKEMTGRIFISHDITALKTLENELRKLNTQLEDRVMARTRELAEAYDTTLEGWARALELRDKETEGHTRRVTDMTLKIAFKLDFPDDMIEHIRRGAILHDIGKMGIPDNILHKPDKLSAEEREIIKKHPDAAVKLLKPIPFLEQAMDIPYCHHEKWDGTGYPRGLKGREIPVAARIFAIADVWDALSFERTYNKPWSHEKMIAHFIEESGKHFDPHLVNIFLDMVEKGEI